MQEHYIIKTRIVKACNKRRCHSNVRGEKVNGKLRVKDDAEKNLICYCEAHLLFYFIIIIINFLGNS